MKTFKIILVVLIWITSVSAQEKKGYLSYSTNVGAGMILDGSYTASFLWKLSADYNFHSRWAVNAGTGISVYENVLIPLYAGIKFNILNACRLIPYVSCSAGYSFALKKDTRGGMCLFSSLGLEYPLYKTLRLQCALGYEWQKMKKLRSYENDYFISQFTESLNHHAIVLKLGVIF